MGSVFSGAKIRIMREKSCVIFANGVSKSVGRCWLMAGGTALLGLQFLLQLVLGLREKGVSENQLTLWLREHDLKFNDWLSDLRIEEAKRIIRQCPDWTNETIADACGFTDRIAFQKKFKQKTGLTPTEWLLGGSTCVASEQDHVRLSSCFVSAMV